MLLLFLTLFLNVKMGVKVAVIILLLFICRKDLKGNKFLKQNFTWFYLGMIGIALFNLLVSISSWSANYMVTAATGISFWLLCIAAAAITFSFVTKNDANKLHATISLFFILNALFTIGQLGSFMWDAGSLNPYTYQGMNQKYFIGTGDLLRGITFDVSTTNAILNSMAVLYFLDRRKFHWLLLSMAVMLLTASNFTNLLLFAVLLFQFVFQSDRNQKSIIIVCLCMLIVFLSQVSPQNKHYLNYVWQKVTASKIDTILPEVTPPMLSILPDSILNSEEKKRKMAMLYLDSVRNNIMKKKEEEHLLHNDPKEQAGDISLLQVKPSIPKPNIHSAPYQFKRDTSVFRKSLIDFAISNIPAFDTSLKNIEKESMPGKLIALRQTVHFLKGRPLKILTGAGIGQFSSKLAFRATGLQFAGGYPSRFAYVNDDFRDNHLNLYLNYFSKDQQFHSLMNSPDSVYDQLLAEYGITGILFFLLFYAGYFIKYHRKKSYGLPLLLLLAGAFATGYWFEQLSVVIVFEVMMLLNIKEAKVPNIV